MKTDVSPGDTVTMNIFPRWTDSCNFSLLTFIEIKPRRSNNRIMGSKSANMFHYLSLSYKDIVTIKQSFMFHKNIVGIIVL